MTCPRRLVALVASVAAALLCTLAVRLFPIPDGSPNRLDVDVVSDALDRVHAEREIAVRRIALERLRVAEAPEARVRFVAAVEPDPDAAPVDRLFVAVLRRSTRGLVSPRGPYTVPTWQDAPFLAVGLLTLFSVGMRLRSDRLSDALHENVEIVVNFALLTAVNTVISVTLGKAEAAHVGAVFAVFGAVAIVTWLVGLWLRTADRPLAAYASTAVFALLALPRILP